MVILSLRHVLALFPLSCTQLAAELAAAVFEEDVSVPLTPTTVQERAGAQKEAEHLRSKAAVRGNASNQARRANMLQSARPYVMQP